MILNVETFYLVREDKNMRKAKRILAFALSLVVVFSGINYAAITSNEVAAATVSTTEWTNNGLMKRSRKSLTACFVWKSRER